MHTSTLLQIGEPNSFFLFAFIAVSYQPLKLVDALLNQVNMILNFLVTPYTLLALPLLYYIFPYLRNWKIRAIPGPPVAAFSNLWLMYQCRRGRRYAAVDKAHKKYGTFVRLQPDHVSVADPDAIPIIYGHGNGFLKR